MGGGNGKQTGVKGRINKSNVTKYSRRHLSYFLYSTALPCPLDQDLCSLLLRAVHPIHRSSCDESLKKIHQMGICSSLRGNVCVFWYVNMHEVYADIHPPTIHPSINDRTLFEVGVVRKGINILLDHFVAELVLLLKREKQPCQGGNRTSNTKIAL